MRKLVVFNSVSIDGYFTDAKGDMSWAHKSDPEWNEFTAGNASGGGMLVFGRITYQMMAGYWPTPMAAQASPAVAAGMNAMPKLVFSRTLARADWQNTRLAKSDPAEEIRRLKAESGPGMAVLGSGTIVKQLAEAGLVDEFQLAVSPIALGGGRTLFDGLKDRLKLKLLSSRAFKNGTVFLCYGP